MAAVEAKLILPHLSRSATAVQAAVAAIRNRVVLVLPGKVITAVLDNQAQSHNVAPAAVVPVQWVETVRVTVR
jgi:hypothetical protein